MNKTITFIGHRFVFDPQLENKLLNQLLQQINCGNINYLLGYHGEFDKLVLNMCTKLQKTYRQISITIAVTSFSQLKKLDNQDKPNFNINTVMYDIESVFYKRKILESNKKMVENSDILICYVNPNYTNSGAKTILNYAKRKKIKIINLYNCN